MLFRKNRSVLSSFFIITLSLFTSQLFARKFYFSTSGNDSYTTTQAQNPNTPWKTLVKLEDFGNSGLALAGDTFAFKRGDVFTNGRDWFASFRWYNTEGYTCPSGTAQNPIVFTNYGTGELPNFLFPNPSITTPNLRHVLVFKNVSYIVIDGLQFNDFRFPVNDKVSSAFCSAGLMLGETMQSAVSNCVVKNCNFSNIGYGIISAARYLTIENNTFTNFKSVGDTIGINDIGADAIQPSGSHYLIKNNYISGSWAYANPFNSSSNGLLGGGLEAINDFDSSLIIRNTFIDNSGAMEFGQNRGNQYGPNDDTFAYNLFINNSTTCYINTTGPFACQSGNLRFWNNVVVENKNSRFTGSNNGGDAMGDGQSYINCGFRFFPPYPESKSSAGYYYAWRPFACGTDSTQLADTIFDIRNNIIWLTNGQQAKYSSVERPKSFYRNNIYHLVGSDVYQTNLGIGAQLGSDELISNSKIFSDTTSINPKFWNFNLTTGSPAINFGRYTGIKNDFVGVSIVGNPEAGIYEYSSALLSPPLAPSSISSSTLLLNNCGETVYRFTAPSLPLSTISTAAATGYVWAFTSSTRSRMVLDSGTLNSKTIVVRYFNTNASNVGDSIKLSYSSDRGLSAVSSTIYPKPVTYVPLPPVNLTSELVSDACGARVYRYKVSDLPATTNLSYTGATGYTWTMPFGALGLTGVLDSGSLSSQTIRIKYSSNAAAAIGDSIKVAYTSTCGNSIAKAIKLSNTSLSAPLVPATLTCTLLASNCVSKTYRYVAPELTLASASNTAATGFAWSLNVTTLGSTAVLDSGSLSGKVIVVTYNNTSSISIGDSIKLSYKSACGNSANKSIIFPNPTASVAPASIITEIVSDVCGARVYRYKAPSLPVETSATNNAATGYAWSLPIGNVGSTGVLDSGTLGSQTIRIRYSSNAAASTGDSIKVAYTSSCANSLYRTVSLTNVVINTPAAPATITSFLLVNNCGEKVYRYVAPPLTGSTATFAAATGYRWSFSMTTLGSRAVLDSGSINGQTIIVRYFNSTSISIGDSISVGYTSACGNSGNRKMIFPNPNVNAPFAPTLITAQVVSDVCGERVYRYSVPSLPSVSNMSYTAATGYAWSMPIGSVGSTGILDSGSLSSQTIRVKYSSNAEALAGDSIKVAYTSSCGYSIALPMKLTNTLLSNSSVQLTAPTSITQTLVSNYCGARVYRYSATTSQNNSIGYTWLMPIGTIGSTGVLDSGSLSSQTIRIKYSSNAAATTGDSIKVAYASGCVTGAFKSAKLINVLLTSPIAPSSISSVLLVNNCGEKVYRYIAPALVVPATGYAWTMAVASNATAIIDSGNANGQVVVVRYSNSASSFIGDSIKVAYISGCGLGASRSMIFPNPTVFVPFTPASLTAELVNDICGARVYRYKAPVLPGVSNLSFTAPTGYAWTMPIGSVGLTGVLDSGTLGSQVIRIMYISNAAAGTGDSIKLAYSSTCGNSINKVIRLTNVVKTGCLITRNGNPITQNSTVTNSPKPTALMMKVFPNPTRGSFKISVEGNNAETKVKICDLRGIVLKTLTIKANQTVELGNDLNYGIYFIALNDGKNTKTFRLVKY